MSLLAVEVGVGASRGAITQTLARVPERAGTAPQIIELPEAVLGAGRTVLEAAASEGALLLLDAGSRVGLAWDGRLDSPATLAAELGLDADSVDGEIFLRAWLEWGPRCLERIRGDFAFVVVEPARHRAFAGRDPMFARNLYYLRDGGVLRMASEASLLARPSHAPDVTSLVRFIAGKPYERDRTLYDDIVPFKAGYVAQIDLATANISEKRFWAPNPWRDDGLDQVERAAALRDALSKAIRPRMRGKPVGVMASGGLDSSSAAATAARVAREEGWQPPHLFSFVSTGLPSDESVYQRALAKHIGAPWHPIEAPATGYRPDCFPEMDLFHTSYAPNAVLAQEAVRSGVRILFTGDGSDELQPRTGLEIYSAAENGRWRDTLHFAGLIDAPFSALRWAALGRAIVRSWIPKALLARRHRARRRRPPWLTARANEILDEADRQIEGELAEYQHPDPARNLVCELLTHGIPYTYSRPANQTFFARRGIELRYPFFDLRVIEVLLAIPPLERVRFDQLKPLLRAAVGEDLPPLVRWRRFPSEYSKFFEKAVLSEAALWRRLSHCERLANLGLVDPDALRKALNEWGDGGLSRWDVDGTLTVEAWLERWR